MEDVISNNTQQDSQEQSGSDAKSGGDSESHCAPLTLNGNNAKDQAVRSNLLQGQPFRCFRVDPIDFKSHTSPQLPDGILLRFSCWDEWQAFLPQRVNLPIAYDEHGVHHRRDTPRVRNEDQGPFTYPGPDIRNDGFSDLITEGAGHLV
jgi:hypothetical protein